MHKDLPDLPGHFLLYQTEDGKQRIECRLNQETLWLSLNQIAALFDRDKSVISKHLKKIFEEGELIRDSVVAQHAITATDGKTYQVEYFRLEAVLAVGFRVRSPRGTQFRQWATAQLQEFLTQGFIMDDERMKNPDQSVYFERVDATKPNMGVTHFAGVSPRKSEVTIIKNFLKAEELETLNRIVTAYLEFAELRAKRREPMRMADWIAKLDDFLRLSDYEVLAHAGKITAEQARLKAESEYHDYRKLIDQQPSEVDKHLADTIRKLDRIESKPNS